MTIIDRSPIHTSDIDFYPLSATEWRVSDARFPTTSIQALLGFVAEHDGAFYLTRMNHPLESTPFASFEAITGFLRNQEDDPPAQVR